MSDHDPLDHRLVGVNMLKLSLFSLVFLNTFYLSLAIYILLTMVAGSLSVLIMTSAQVIRAVRHISSYIIPQVVYLAALYFATMHPLINLIVPHEDVATIAFIWICIYALGVVIGLIFQCSHTASRLH